MTVATLEHVNVTVSNPKKTAEFLCRLFDWKIRWHGPSASGGMTYHVGNTSGYLAVFSSGTPQADNRNTGQYLNGLNHIAIVVDDLDDVETKVKREGFEPKNHGDYEPGRRFYFHDTDGIEYEIVSYANADFWKQMRIIADAGIARR